MLSGRRADQEADRSVEPGGPHPELHQLRGIPDAGVELRIRRDEERRTRPAGHRTDGAPTPAGEAKRTHDGSWRLSMPCRSPGAHLRILEPVAVGTPPAPAAAAGWSAGPSGTARRARR